MISFQGFNMNIVSITMIIFVTIELLNVLTLYVKPGFKKGNGLGVFSAWEQSKKDEAVHALIKYLVYWVAGTKLIFIGLLIVIIILGDPLIQLSAAIVLLLSISTFFWKLYPLIKKMDDQNELNQKGYSKTLGLMITGFIIMFIIAILYTLVS